MSNKYIDIRARNKYNITCMHGLECFAVGPLIKLCPGHLLSVYQGYIFISKIDKTNKHHT